MDKFETVNEIVDPYFSSSSPLKSKIYSALGSLLLFLQLLVSGFQDGLRFHGRFLQLFYFHFQMKNYFVGP